MIFEPPYRTPRLTWSRIMPGLVEHTNTMAIRIVIFLLALVNVAPGQYNQARGNAPGNVPQTTFFIHQISTDHAEGITTIDMNGDGFLDLVSGAYWYENPGPQGGEWKRHQWRTVSMTGEFVSDCGEWTVDVNHDGAPDIVTAGWITNGLWWYEHPKQPGAMWKRHLVADSFDTEGGV